MNFRLIAALAIFLLTSAPAFAAGNYRTSSTHPLGNSHNNYHASPSDYGPSKHDYSGHPQYTNGPQYTGAPQYTNHPADYSTSAQALASSAAY